MKKITWETDPDTERPRFKAYVGENQLCVMDQCLKGTWRIIMTGDVVKFISAPSPAYAKTLASHFLGKIADALAPLMEVEK